MHDTDDFAIYFQGQPNRRTGDCDGDIFSLFGGSSGEFKFCGQNNGQHSEFATNVRMNGIALTHDFVIFSLLRCAKWEISGW